MKKLIIGSLAVIAISAAAPAQAADMPMKAAPRPILVSSWGGWYAGINGGYGWGDPDAIVNPSGAPLPAGTVTNFTGGSPFTLSTRPRGWLGGVQLGYNWMINPTTMVGVEADFQFSNLKDSASGGYINTYSLNGDATRTVGIASLETKMDWFATFRGRYGWVVAPTVMPYVTGGLAIANIKTSLTNAGSHFDIGGGIPGTLISSFNNSASFSDIQFGFAVGGGLDWMVSPAWVVRTEYLYLNFAGKTYNAPLAGITSASSKLDAHIARLAINYRFAP